MTRYFFTLLFTALFLCLPVEGVLAWEGIVVKVLDGDSIKVQREGVIHEIRLYGIDTPEYKQPYSNKAKQFTKKLTFRQVVSVVEKDVDRYGRIVALVTSRGKMVNLELVREGLAWFYPRYCLEQPICGEMRRLEKKARAAGRGLWRDKSPVAPWDWKRRKKFSRSKENSRWIYRLLSWL